MRKLLLALILIATACSAQEHPAGPIQPKSVQPAAAISQESQKPSAEILVAAGTTVPLTVTRPVWANAAAIGSDIFAETIFPVSVSNQMAIPAGTYVEGQIEALSRPRFFSPHAQVEIRFSTLIFANGYAVLLENAANTADVIPAVANVYLDVSAASDLLFDNGTQIQMVFQLPLHLDASRIAQAIRQARPFLPSEVQSATRCVPTPGTPGTPGTPDTVIPGTPGTPPTVIPGGPGMPDTVIPGTPATPDTVIPGTPGTAGTPGTSCPEAPLAASSPRLYREEFETSAPFLVEGQKFPAGKYEVRWKGIRPAVTVSMQTKGGTAVRESARLVLLDRPSPANEPKFHADSNGAISLDSVRFAGRNYALYFDLQHGPEVNNP